MCQSRPIDVSPFAFLVALVATTWHAFSRLVRRLQSNLLMKLSRTVQPMIALAVLLTTTFVPRSGRACSFCFDSLMRPSRQSLPANKLYIRALREPVGTDPAPEILRADGGRVASGFQKQGQDRVFGPTEAVTAGETLTFRVPGCSSTTFSEYSIKAGPASALPASIGQLKVDESGFKLDPKGEKIPTTDVVLEPTPEMAATWGLSEMTVEIDGQRVLDDTKHPARTSDAAPGFKLTLSANCDPSRPSAPTAKDECSPKTFDWLAPGKHVLTVKMHVLGADQDPPPATAEFQVKCMSADVPVGMVDEGGGGGCSVSPSGGATGPGVIVLGLAALGFATVRRRRKNR